MYKKTIKINPLLLLHLSVSHITKKGCAKKIEQKKKKTIFHQHYKHIWRVNLVCTYFKCQPDILFEMCAKLVCTLWLDSCFVSHLRAKFCGVSQPMMLLRQIHRTWSIMWQKIAKAKPKKKPKLFQRNKKKSRSHFDDNSQRIDRLLLGVDKSDNGTQKQILISVANKSVVYCTHTIHYDDIP